MREKKATGSKMLDQLGTFHKLLREHAIPRETRKWQEEQARQLRTDLPQLSLTCLCRLANEIPGPPSASWPCLDNYLRECHTR